MLLTARDVIHAPVAQVVHLIRDNLSELVPFLPNIAKIERVELKDHATLRAAESATEQTRLNHWFAKVEVPAIAKKYLRPEFFGWRELTTWGDDSLSAKFQIESFVGKNFFEASGTYVFRALTDHSTEITVSCEVLIHAERVRGVPELLAKTATPLIERVIRKMIEPSLSTLGHCLNAYFAQDHENLTQKTL